MIFIKGTIFNIHNQALTLGSEVHISHINQFKYPDSTAVFSAYNPEKGKITIFQGQIMQELPNISRPGASRGRSMASFKSLYNCYTDLKNELGAEKYMIFQSAKIPICHQSQDVLCNENTVDEREGTFEIWYYSHRFRKSQSMYKKKMMVVENNLILNEDMVKLSFEDSRKGKTIDFPMSDIDSMVVVYRDKEIGLLPICFISPIFYNSISQKEQTEFSSEVKKLIETLLQGPFDKTLIKHSISEHIYWQLGIQTNAFDLNNWLDLHFGNLLQTNLDTSNYSKPDDEEK